MVQAKSGMPKRGMDVVHFKIRDLRRVEPVQHIDDTYSSCREVKGAHRAAPD